jgi:hypothetical protein
MLLVRVRAGIDQSVAVGWAATEVPALEADLSGHRRGGAPASPEDLALGLVAEQLKQGSVGGSVRSTGSSSSGSQTSMP